MEKQIWLYRLYDVAYEFDLENTEQILAKEKQTNRLKLNKVKPKSIIIENPPVSADITRLEVNLNNKWQIEANLTVRVYSIGAISLILKLMIPDCMSYDELKELSAYLYSSQEVEDIFKKYLEIIKKTIAGAFEQVDREVYVEDFTIYFFKKWEKEWDPAPLLLFEKEELSRQITEDTLANSFSYGKNDLTIINWDSALVYDKEGSSDIPDILEFALTELLTLRYYDSLLAKKIDAIHDDVKKAGTFGWYARLSRFRKINKNLMEIVAEVSEITEKIQNSFKVTEDVFYARIYGAALNVFKTQNWSNSIEHKISIIQRTYQMLSAEIENSRATFLEAAIVFLIVFEIVLNIFRI